MLLGRNILVFRTRVILVARCCTAPKFFDISLKYGDHTIFHILVVDVPALYIVRLDSVCPGNV